MNVEETSGEKPSDLKLEIAHILLLDVVGYSRLLVNEQIELLQQLNRIVRNTAHFRRAESDGRLTRLPTGDGMALIFYSSPEDPAQCALEISAAVKSQPNISLRMGVHSGPVNRVTDVNDQTNLAGAGINIAQRVMDCGDAGHILLSKHVADDLSQYRHWQPYLHDLGECAVKHGQRLHIVNLCKDDLGNCNLPQKLHRRSRWQPSGVPSLRGPLLLAAALLATAALIGATFWFLHRAHPASALMPAVESRAPIIPQKSIAVLPFENLSNNQENAFFSDGVQNEIVTDLARVADLKVISRSSMMQYRNAAARNMRQIGKELGVANLLEGSVQRSDGTVRVNAQLVDARTDAQLWADHYDRSIVDVFAIETELAKQIVAQLKVKLSVEEQAAIEEQPTHDLDAYSLYLRGKDLINAIAFSPRAKETLFEAVALLEDAVRRDPAFARAYYELARAHDQVYFLGFDHTPARLALAKAAIDALLRLQPNSGEAHLAQAQHFYWGYREYARARAELVAARKALPNEPLALLLQGYIDRREGHWNESISAMEQAMSLDPRNAFVLQQVSFTYLNLRRFADESATLDKVLAIVPGDLNTRLERAQVDLNARADIEPLRAAIASASKEGAEAMAEAADFWRTLALCSRDPETAKRALAHTSSAGTDQRGFHHPKAWWEGWMARALHDDAEAGNAFARARSEMEPIVQGQPDYAPALVALGVIDAALGRKDDAVREGKRAVELLPISKDAFTGAELLENLAVIYAIAGEKDLACEQLEVLANNPSGLTYGQLRLHPNWDPLRGDPRFEKIIASLAPK